MKEALSERFSSVEPTFRASGLLSASECIGELSTGCRIIGMTMGQFSLLDLIRAVLAQTGPADVVVSTWSAGIRDIENAEYLLQSGAIRSLRMLVDRSFPGRQPDYCRELRRRFGDDCVRATRTHAKFALVSNARWRITIRSSMNLNRNPRFEQFDLDESAEIHAFFERLVREVEEAMPPGPDHATPLVDEVFGGLMGGRVDDGWRETTAEEEVTGALKRITGRGRRGKPTMAQRVLRL